MRALKIAALGMTAQQTRVEVISNNLANMSTTGYKMRRAEFTDLLYETPRQAGTINAADGTVLPAGVQLGLGVRTAAVTFSMKQGAMNPTDEELNVAIDGHGWFEIAMPDGTSAYTRDGSFKKTAEGQIVTTEGYPVVPDMTIPGDARRVVINQDGEVYAHFNDQIEPQLLGRIQITEFVNDQGLEPRGQNLFRETLASGPPTAGDANTENRGRVLQGYLEESSVDPVNEMTELIQAQRGYELNSKVISASDQMLGATTQIR